MGLRGEALDWVARGEVGFEPPTRTLWNGNVEGRSVANNPVLKFEPDPEPNLDLKILQSEQKLSNRVKM